MASFLTCSVSVSHSFGPHRCDAGVSREKDTCSNSLHDGTVVEKETHDGGPELECECDELFNVSVWSLALDASPS